MNEKIRALIDARLVRALKEKVSQKLITIAKVYGKRIISHDFSMAKDFWHEEGAIYDPMDVQTVEEDAGLSYGWHFSGLSWGINLCVTLLGEEDRIVETKATYNGYTVYHESDGKVVAYAPFEKWENFMNMIYEAAIEKEKKKLTEEKEIKREEYQQRLRKFWVSFKQLWGY